MHLSRWLDHGNGTKAEADAGAFLVFIKEWLKTQTESILESWVSAPLVHNVM